MFIDASALTAIIAQEEDAYDLSRKLGERVSRTTSPLAVWEASLALARILNLSPEEAVAELGLFLQASEIEIIAIVPEIAALAVQAYARFGKGRHPAALNMGDCFAYACARYAQVPLLYKGGDFTETDIDAA